MRFAALLKKPRNPLLRRFLASSLIAATLVVTLPSGFASAEDVNLVTNPGAETGDFTGWSVYNGGSGWSIGWQSHSGGHGFISSYNWGSIAQEIDLVSRGYSGTLLDTQPTIDFSTYVVAIDSGSKATDKYQVQVELRNASHGVIASYDSGQTSVGTTWTNVARSFTGYGTGVRYVYVRLYGIDDGYWAGQFGSVFDDTSVIVHNPDTSAPAISDVAATSGQTTASVTWTTDEPASSVVQYGLTDAYGSTATGSSGVTGHAVGLTGLTASTAYHYRVCSTDASANQACSSDRALTTDIASPTAAADTYSMMKNVGVDIAAAAGVMANDAGPGTLSAVLVSGPAHAAAFTFRADGSFAYTPAINFVATDTFTYKVNNGYDSNTATVSLVVSSNDSTVDNSVILSRLEAGAVTSADVSFTLQNTLSTAFTMTFPVGFSVVSPFTSGTCSGGGTVDNFGYDPDARTLTADKHNCAGTLSLSGATVQNPVAPGTYVINWVNDDPGSVTVVILGTDQINVAATVDPSMTFEVGASSSCHGTFVAGDWDIDVGSLNAGRRVASSGDGEGTQLICTRLSTNATNGAVVTVRNQNGASGLVSLGVPADSIPSASAVIASGTPNYGLCYGTASGDSGRDLEAVPVATAPDSSLGAFSFPACTSSVVSGAESVGGLSTAPAEVWRVPHVTSGAFASLRLKVAVSATQPAHDDYADQLTFVATSTY